MEFKTEDAFISMTVKTYRARVVPVATLSRGGQEAYLVRVLLKQKSFNSKVLVGGPS